MVMPMGKKIPTEEYRQKKINDGKTKISDAFESFKGALNSVLEDAVSPVYEKVEGIYKNAATVGDFAKADIMTQKIVAELVDLMDRNLKRLVS